MRCSPTVTDAPKDILEEKVPSVAEEGVGRCYPLFGSFMVSAYCEDFSSTLFTTAAFTRFMVSIQQRQSAASWP